MLELALGASLLTLLFAGVVGFGPMFYNAIEIGDAARAGAVYGTANPGDTTGMQNTAIASASNVQNVTSTATRTCQCYGTSGTVSCSSTCAGSVTPMMYVTVTAQATINPMFQNPLAPGTIVARTVTMRAR